MNMKNVIARIVFPLFLILTIIISTAAPVFGTSEAEPQNNARSSYRTGTIVIGGVSYTYSASIGCSSASGAYSCVTVHDSIQIRRSHGTITVAYVTTDAGTQVETGGAKGITCTGTSYSYYVPYSGGMDKVSSYAGIRGSITLYADTNFVIELSA